MVKVLILIIIQTALIPAVYAKKDFSNHNVAVARGDFNEDSIPDLLVATSCAFYGKRCVGEVRFYAGQKGMSFLPGKTIGSFSSTRDTKVALSVMDLNDDSFQDFIVVADRKCASCGTEKTLRSIWVFSNRSIRKNGKVRLSFFRKTVLR